MPLKFERSETAAFPRPEQPSPADVSVSSALSTNNARRMVGVSSHSSGAGRVAPLPVRQNRVDRIGLAVMVITTTSAFRKLPLRGRPPHRLTPPPSTPVSGRVYPRRDRGRNRVRVRIHVTAITGARQKTCNTAVRRRACRSASRLLDQEDRMKQNPKWTAATLVVLAAATVHTMHALAIAPVPMVH